MAELLDVARVLAAVEVLVVVALGVAVVAVLQRPLAAVAAGPLLSAILVALEAAQGCEGVRAVAVAVAVETAGILAAGVALMAVRAIQENVLPSPILAADSAQRRQVWAQT